MDFCLSNIILTNIKKEESSFSIASLTMNFPHDNMITLKEIKFKSNVNKYTEHCIKRDFFTYSCPSCNCPGCLVKHGYYKRTVTIKGIKHRINILRVKCKSCGKTHAILPDFIIPYFQTSLDDAILIITNQIDVNKYYTKKDKILKSYRKWINRVLSVFSSLTKAFEDLHQLLITCSKHFNLCFLQNHRGKYYCF